MKNRNLEWIISSLSPPSCMYSFRGQWALHSRMRKWVLMTAVHLSIRPNSDYESGFTQTPPGSVTPGHVFCLFAPCKDVCSLVGRCLSLPLVRFYQRGDHLFVLSWHQPRLQSLRELYFKMKKKKRKISLNAGWNILSEYCYFSKWCSHFHPAGGCGCSVVGVIPKAEGSSPVCVMKDIHCKTVAQYFMSGCSPWQPLQKGAAKRLKINK